MRSGGDLHDTIAFSASRASVRDVLTEGEMLVQNGHLTNLDLEQITTRADRALEKILARVSLDS